MLVDINLTPTGSRIEIPKKTDSLQETGERPVQTNISSTINASSWGSANDCKAACLLVHGLGAHSLWYEALARRLKIRRIFSLAYDQIGFGKRSNETLMMKQQWLDDLNLCLDYLIEAVGDRPIVLIGNSMGAVIAMRAALARQGKDADALIMFSPGFDGNRQTFSLGYRVRAIANALLQPDKLMQLPYTTDDICREPQIKQWLATDADAKLQVTARTLLEILKLTEETKGMAKKLQCPTLMFTAGQEKIVNNQCNQEIFEKIAAPIKKHIHYADAWHDLMFDPVIDQLAEELSGFLNETVLKKNKSS